MEICDNGVDDDGDGDPDCDDLECENDPACTGGGGGGGGGGGVSSARCEAVCAITVDCWYAACGGSAGCPLPEDRPQHVQACSLQCQTEWSEDALECLEADANPACDSRDGFHNWQYCHDRCEGQWFQPHDDDETRAAQIAALQGCEVIRGGLNLQGAPPDVDFLMGLTRIEGGLEISGDDALDLAGLSRLEIVGGSLTIENTALVNLDFLSSLSTVVADLTIGQSRADSALENVDGLSNLRTVGIGHYVTERGEGVTDTGWLHVIRNPGLADLAGLSNLTTVGDGLKITDNSAMVDTGLTSLTTVGSGPGRRLGRPHPIKGGVEISGNPNLADFGMPSLTSIGGVLSIRGGSDMLGFDGMSRLTSVGKDFSVPEGWSTAGLEALTTVGGRLVLKGVSDLRGLAALETVGASPSQLRPDGCLTVLDGFNRARDAVVQLQSLAGLSSLRTVRCLILRDNIQLANVDALSNLVSVGEGGMSITGVQQLANLDGLSNLATIDGGLNIGGNQLLTSVGLTSLTQVGGDLVISQNGRLASVAGLSRLTSVTGTTTISNNRSLCQSTVDDFVQACMPCGAVGVVSGNDDGC